MGVCWGNCSSCRTCVYGRWQSPGRRCFSFPPFLCRGKAGHDAWSHTRPGERSSGAPWMLFHGPSVGLQELSGSWKHQVWVFPQPQGVCHKVKLWKRSLDHWRFKKPNQPHPKNPASLGIPLTPLGFGSGLNQRDPAGQCPRPTTSQEAKGKSPWTLDICGFFSKFQMCL